MACSLTGCCFLFFFSSRRRHTRCLSDWSSDVCSSDLHQDDKLTHIRPLFFFVFPSGPLRERERQTFMDANECLYRFYSLNMTCIKSALLSHPPWIGCESQIGAVFAFSMAK